MPAQQKDTKGNEWVDGIGCNRKTDSRDSLRSPLRRIKS